MELRTSKIMFSGDGREGVSQPALGSDAYTSLDIGLWDWPLGPLTLWPASRQPPASQPSDLMPTRL